MVVAAAVAVGFRKIRLTGGEPTLRAGPGGDRRPPRRVPGSRDLAMTTNGVLLPRARAAASSPPASGASTSTSTASTRTRVARLMRWGTLAEIWAGLEAAEAAGLRRSRSTPWSSAATTRTTSCRSPRSRSSATGTCASSRPCRSAAASRPRVARAGLVPTAETRARIEAVLGPLVAPPAATTRRTRRANYRLPGAKRRRRVHQPGERAVLRHLQPHAPHRRGPLPSLPAERRRARRPRRPA